MKPSAIAATPIRASGARTRWKRVESDIGDSIQITL
jgi:hypothetical protein